MEQDMEVLSKLTEDQKVAFMKAFSRLAGADGHLDEDELAFIRSMARIYGISDKRVDEILKIDSDEEVVINDFLAANGMDKPAALEAE